MRHVTTIVAVVLGGLLMTLGSTRTAATAASEGGAVFQSEDDALAADLALLAQSKGWTIAQTDQYYRATEAVGLVATRVAELRPKSFVGSAMGPRPGDPPTIYVKGPADEAIRALIADAGVPIQIADQQPFSSQELEAQKLNVHNSIMATGHSSVFTWVEMTAGNRIHVAVAPASGRLLSAAEVLAAVPPGLRGRTTATISSDRLFVPEAAYGGMQLRRSGVNECTSGFSVNRTVFPTSTDGIGTAGHCISQNQIVHPGHAVHAMTYRSRVEGAYGDFQWLTTTELEPDDFYADASMIRDVTSVEPAASFTVGEPICGYGRQTNDRDCSLEVLIPSAACEHLDRLVVMNGDTLGGGDSGGPWYWGNRAYGFHTGNCDGLDAFSKADHIDEALGGVKVKTQ